MTGIIDMRLRPPLKAWVEGTTFQTAMYYPRKVPNFPGARSAWTESMDELFREMDTAGIGTGVIMGRASTGKLGGVSNEAIIEALDTWPERFVGFLATDLERIDASIDDIRRHADHPRVKGISIEPGSSATPRMADDSVLDPIYELCRELELPVSISLSGLLSALAGHDLSWCSPIPVQRVAMRYPDLPIIASHAAWPWAEQMVVIALTCPNIYVSPDLYIATAGIPARQPYIDAANLYLADRTLFGSAYPTRPLEDAVRDFLDMGWRPEIVDRILSGNARRVLKL